MINYSPLEKAEIGTGVRKFGFHPVAILRTVASIKNFEDKNIRKIIRELAFHHSKIQTRHTGDDVGNILSFIKKTENVPGDILDLGTWFRGFYYFNGKIFRSHQK